MALPKDNNNHDERKDEQPKKSGLSALKSDSASKSSKKPVAKDKEPAKKEIEEKKKKKLSPAVLIPGVSVLVVGGLVGGLFWYNATEEEEVQEQEYGDSSIAQYEEERSESRSSLAPNELLDYAYTRWEDSVGDDLSSWQGHIENQDVNDIEIPEDFLGDGSGLEDEPDADWDGEGHETEWNGELHRPMTEWDKNPESAPPGILSRMHIEDIMRQNQRIRSAASQYPSRAEGYMNNPEQVYLDDDNTLNPMYSFILSEDIEFFFGHTVQRLINPLYGDWTGLTLGIDNKNSTIARMYFGDMFSSDWFEENIQDNDISALPILANWENKPYEDFGREWYGEMENVKITFQDDSDVFDAVIDVKYSRYALNGSVEEKNGVLTLTASPNYESPEDVNNRYVITDAKLSMK